MIKLSTHIKKKQLSAAYRYSYARLALNLYGYFETEAQGDTLPPEISSTKQSFLKLMNEFFSGTLKEEEMAGLREQISHCVSRLLGYADCFQIYEYVFNRLEKRFVTGKNIPVDEKQLVGRMMYFFTSAEDPMVMNSRIKSVLEEVPIRFTKSKFFSMVKESLGSYVGGSKRSLEHLFEKVNTFRFLHNPEPVYQWEEKLAGLLSDLSQLDYKHLTAEVFKDYENQLSEIAGCVIGWVESLHLLQELVNDLYVLLLCENQVMIEMGEESVVSQIVSDLLSLFSTQEERIPEELTERLSLLEGKQEYYYEKYMAFENETPTDETLQKVDKLLSGSAFVSLSAEDFDEGTVDQEWLNQRTDEFFAECSKALDGKPKVVVRAVMAKFLSEIPLWFRSLDEIQTYITEGFDTCTDIFEKETSVELIEMIMEMEHVFV